MDCARRLHYLEMSIHYESTHVRCARTRNTIVSDNSAPGSKSF